MAFQSAPQAAEARLLFDLNDGSKRSGFSVIARKSAGDWTEADLSFLADACSDWAINEYVPILSEDHAFVGVKCKDLEHEFPLVAEIIQPAPVAGTVVSPALPNNIAVAVTWIGAAGSAPRSGRSYFVSPAESQVTNSALTGAFQTALTDAAGALRTALEPITGVAGSSQAIVSRYSGTSEPVFLPSGKKVTEPIKRAVAVVNGVTGLRVGSRIDTQKKRLPREAA